MRKLFAIKLIIINILIFAFGVGLFLILKEIINDDNKSDTALGIIAGTLGTPIIGLISFEIKCVFKWLEKDKKD